MGVILCAKGSRKRSGALSPLTPIASRSTNDNAVAFDGYGGIAANAQMDTYISAVYAAFPFFIAKPALALGSVGVSVFASNIGCSF